MEGFKRVGCENLSEMKKTLSDIAKSELTDMNEFKIFYNYVFDFARGDDGMKKVLDVDIAIAMWSIVLKDRFNFFVIMD